MRRPWRGAFLLFDDEAGPLTAVLIPPPVADIFLEGSFIAGPDGLTGSFFAGAVGLQGSFLGVANLVGSEPSATLVKSGSFIATPVGLEGSA